MGALIKSTPVQHIRSDSDIFRTMIIYSMNRIHMHVRDAIKSRDPDEIQALEAEVGVLDSFVGPYYEEEYQIFVEKIEKKLEDAAYEVEAGRPRVYVKLIRDWIREIVKRFGNPSIAILPAISTSYVQGKGQGKVEDFDDSE